MIGYAIIGLLIVLNSLAQILEKKGVMLIDQPLGLNLTTIQKMITNPYLIGGILCAGASLIIWLYVLSRYSISYVQPLTSLVYVIVALMAYFVLGEQITVLRATGIGVIVIGCVLINL